MDKREAYFNSLIPYIPRTIARWYGSADSGQRHILSEHSGVVVCIDASGFTALTRQLSSHGKEGPEILTRVLNLFFEQMSQVIFSFDGDVLKFAGDALWAFFPEDLAIGAFHQSVLAALERVNGADELHGKTQLKIHMGAEVGSFHLASLGDPRLRLEAEPVGNMFDVVYRACDTAADNQFAIGPALAFRHQSMAELSHIDDEFSLLSPPASPPGPPDALVTATDNVDVTKIGPGIEPYLPQDVLNRIRTSGSSLSVQGEHRQVVVLFANFENNFGRKGDDPTVAVTQLNEKLSRCFELIAGLHGSVARIDPFKRGHKLLVLFGAPTKREDDEISALQCATKLLELADSSFRIRIGLATGTLFCGDVGALQRREYTVMGEGINLAARLMSKASWSELLIGDTLRSRLPQEVRTEKMTLSLKGIGDAAVCYRFLAIAESSTATMTTSRTIGQQTEMDRIVSAWRRVHDGERQLLVIGGDTGVGKTTLMTNFLRDHAPDCNVHLACKNARLFGRGWLTKKLFESLLVRNSLFSGKSVAEFVAERVEERWQPLLADILDSVTRDNEWTRGMTGELRTAKTRELLADLVSSVVASPVVLAVDDCDKADDLFRILLSSLSTTTTDDLPILLLALCRDFSHLENIGQNQTSIDAITLGAPSEQQWWDYFAQEFESGLREKDLFARVLAASGGNPHFIMQFLEQRRQSQQLVQNPVSRKWELADAGVKISVPDGLASLHLSVFDGLPENLRTILKAASATVGDFSPKLLATGLDEHDVSEIQRSLEQLSGAELLEPNDKSGRYSFVHTSMKEAIYQCIPKAQLRQLHLQYARMAELKSSSGHFSLLAHHYYRADAPAKGFDYSLRAAVEAFEAHALNEAAEFFEQCLDIMMGEHEVGLDASLRLEFYRRYSAFLKNEGRYNDAYKIYHRWRRLSERAGDTHNCLLAAVETASALWVQTKYARCQKVLRHIMSLGQRHDDRVILVRVHSLAAQIDRRTGNLASGQQQGERAVAMADTIDDRTALFNAKNILGLVYWSSGKLSDAARLYEEAIRAGQDDQVSLAHSQNNLAIIEQELGHFVQSEKLLTEALSIFKSVGDRKNQSYAAGNLANLCRIFGKLRLSEDLFRQADHIFERHGDQHAHYYTVGNLGDLDLVRGELDSAKVKFDEVVEFARKVEDKELIAECSVRFGDLAFFGRHTAEAEAKYREAIKLSEEIGSVEYLIRGNIGLARVLIGERDHRSASEVIGRISELAKSNKAILVENEAVFLAGEHHRIKNELPQAANCYGQTLAYARNQNLFELILKSAVRLYEANPPSQTEITDVLSTLRETFISHNGAEAWEALADSAYFSYFSNTLKQIAGIGEFIHQ